MKKSYKKIIVIEIIAILFIFFGNFVLYNYILKNNIYYIIFWLILFTILKLSLGLEKNKNINRTNIFLEVFIYSFIYILFEYLLGIFIGFIKSPYSLNLLDIIKNILPLLLLIILEELSRNIIISKGRKNIIIIILNIMLFILFDIIDGIELYDITSKLGIFDNLIMIFLPSLSRNILLTYITYQSGYKSCILYRIILELIVFIVPIYANLGNYLDSIFKIASPLIFLLRLRTKFGKKDRFESKNHRMLSKLLLSTMLMILFNFILLVSGYFKYYALVIASGSMYPNIAIGDVVLVKKINKNELKYVTEDDILVYQYDNKTIVHRIVKISNINGKYIYQTKGDANKEEDNWLIYENQVIGIVKFKIKYIGYLTVQLNNYLNQ